ncbi:class I SAM-dependent methyltransferase [Candidatus Woesearchaeota archaeon]|nr:class I SAM-dependent methyltransferase [Candidatus Woesearchaeota archaeon]
MEPDETTAAYDRHAAAYSQKFEKHFAHIHPFADQFVKHISGKRVLDLGAGPGHHAEYFRAKGLYVVCADLSSEMARMCRTKGLAAARMDMLSPAFTASCFDGVWAYASLLHIPKNEVGTALNSISRIAKPSAIIGIAVKEGSGEGLEHDDEHPDVQRWFSYYTCDELERLLRPRFDIITASKRQSSARTVFLEYLLRA